jgi:hypothetical protein
MPLKLTFAGALVLNICTPLFELVPFQPKVELYLMWKQSLLESSDFKFYLSKIIKYLLYNTGAI